MQLLNKEKAKISKGVSNIVDLFRIVMCVFLICTVFVWLAQIFHFEMHVPFYGRISEFLTKFNSYFATQDIRDEVNNSIMFFSINLLILLFLITFFNGIVKDMMKMYERSREEAIEEDNMRINEQIKKNYEYHLKHTMHFLLLLRLRVSEDSYKTSAFVDDEYSAKLKKELDDNLEEIRNMFRNGIQCEKTNIGDDMAFSIQTPEQLNRILVFIRSVCKIDKYVKSGLVYFMAVMAHTADENPSVTMEEALRLLNLECKNRIVCYQIVAECLKTVNDNNFIAHANGNYEDIPSSLYELVEKSSY